MCHLGDPSPHQCTSQDLAFRNKGQLFSTNSSSSTYSLVQKVWCHSCSFCLNTAWVTLRTKKAENQWKTCFILELPQGFIRQALQLLLTSVGFENVGVLWKCWFAWKQTNIILLWWSLCLRILVPAVLLTCVSKLSQAFHFCLQCLNLLGKLFKKVPTHEVWVGGNKAENWFQ